MTKPLWQSLRIGFVFLLGGVFCFSRGGAEASSLSLERWLDALSGVGKEAQGHSEAQKAWSELVRHAEPTDLPTILARIDPNQPLASNWLLLAAQTIWDRAARSGKPIPWDTLLPVYQNRNVAPRARFLVYQWLVEARPEEKSRLLAQALDDPSLDIRREALELFLDQVQKTEQAGQTPKAVADYRKALSYARDPDQIEAIAKALRRLGEAVDLARHFGFVRQWKLIGPFDNTDGRGFAASYPPETEWDPKAEYPGKHGPVRWIDSTTEDDYGMVDFNKALGEEKEVVGYGATEFPLRTAQEAQIRIGTPNALKLWVNGQQMAAHEVYHSGSQMDQYVVSVPLRAGKNFLLVKVCQNNIQQDWARFWRFQLRICQPDGTAILPDPSNEPEKKEKQKVSTGPDLRPHHSSSPLGIFREVWWTTSSERLRAKDLSFKGILWENPSGTSGRTSRSDAALSGEDTSWIGSVAFAASMGDGATGGKTAEQETPEKPGGPWPQFRGPGGNPVHRGNAPPVRLDPEKNLAWKAMLPGRGPSSPIVVAGRVMVTASSGPRQDRLHVLCFDAETGKLVWHRWFWATGSTVCNPFSAVAAPTPVSNGREVVVFFSSNDLACFDLEGNLRWIRGLAYEHPLTRNDVGMASSPLLVGETVVVQCETFGDSFAAALRLDDGQTLWRVPRAATSMWASPVAYPQPNGKDYWVVMHSRSALTALDVHTGREAWRHETGCHSMASSVVVGDRILLPGGGMQCLRWDPQRGRAELLWRQNRLVCGAPSPAVLDGKIYTIRDPGILICGDLTEGRILWQLRLEGPIWATPVIAGGHLYCVNHGGLVQVVELPEGHGAEPGRVVSTCRLDQGILATPALADGAIYFRSDKAIWKFATSPASRKSTEKNATSCVRPFGSAGL